MILTVLDSGVDKPLDVFEDFKIEYNHQFDDYTSIASYRIPYTNKFKIPLTDRNRQLLGIPFDLSLPKEKNVSGKVTKTDGTLVFNCTYQVERQVVNVLEPYIEITMLDALSDAIKQLSTSGLDDLFKDVEFDLTELWLYGTDTPHPYPTEKPFVFPFFDWNNKPITFAHDPMRDLSQLQPTFIVRYLIEMIFASVGVDIQSQFLETADQIHTGISSTELGLMLPCRFYSDNEAKVSSKITVRNTARQIRPYSFADRSRDFATTIPTVARLLTEDFNGFLPNSVGPKLNYSSYEEFEDDNGAIFASEFCSMVDGKLKVVTSPSPSGSKIRMMFGPMAYDDAPNGLQYANLQSIANQNFGTLDVHIVSAQFENDMDIDTGYNLDTPIEENSSQVYDVQKSYKVGEATFIGFQEFSFIFGDYNCLIWEVTFTEQFEFEQDVEANQRMSLSYVLRAPDDAISTCDIVVQDDATLQTGTYTMSFDKDRMRMEWISGSQGDKYDFQMFTYDNHTGYPLNLEFSFPEPTEYPPITSFNKWRDDAFVPGQKINLGESYKQSLPDMRLIDIVKMVMGRFNLSLYSLSDGSIHLDTAENRSTGSKDIDYLIDEAIVTEYRYNELGLLTMKDNNPSFYPDGYNALDKYEINEDKDEETSLSLSSAIVRQEGMFQDKYDNSGYELLKLINDSNFWGTSDRPQASVDSYKPTFIFFQDDLNDIAFPVNTNIKGTTSGWYEKDSAYAEASNVIVGFFNRFYTPDKDVYIDDYRHKTKAVNISSGYTLESFRDNAPRNTYTTYINQWRERIYTMMDNDTVTLSMDIYISEDNFADFTNFPTIDYYGSQWEMTSFSNYPFSAQDGGVSTLYLSKSEPLPPPTEPPEPPETLNGFTMYGSALTQEDACLDTNNPVSVYHNGVSSYPTTGDFIYVDKYGETTYVGNGYYFLQTTVSTIQVAPTGEVLSVGACSPPDAGTTILSTTYNDVVGELCTEPSNSIERYHDGSGSYPVVGDFIYQDALLTQPVNGGNFYWKNKSKNSLIVINPQGQITLEIFC